MSRLLSALLMSSLACGCGYDVSVHQEVSRGPARIYERPIDVKEAVAPQAVAEATYATITLPAQRCVTTREVPVVTTTVTERTSRWTNGLGWLLAAGAWAGLGALSWSSVDSSPEECPPNDEKCTTKSEARGGAYVSWGLSAAFAGYGVYAAIPKTQSTRDAGVSTTESEASAPGACSKALGGIPVELRLPNGRRLTATTDERGVARVAFGPDALDGLARSAVASVWVSGKQTSTLELAAGVAEAQRRSGRHAPALVASPVVGASGHLTADTARVEVMLSPQAVDGSFVGDFLTRGAFEFQGVTATPLRGGEAIPLSLTVQQLDASMPKATGDSAIVVFDSSGSMRQNDPGRRGRWRAAEAFLAKLRPSTEVAVLDFGVGTTDGLDVSRLLAEFTSDRERLRSSLQQLGESGGTPLYESLNDALTVYERSQRSGPVLLLTDGQANRIDEVTQRAIQAGVPVYAVGFGKQLDFDNLRDLGLQTGGFFLEAPEIEALEKAFEGIALGVSVGRVRVFGTGPASTPLAPGEYRVRGNVVTRGPQGAERVATPFELTGRVAPQ